MTNTISTKIFSRPPIATGWNLWLTWFFVILYGLGTITNILWIVFGSSIFARTGVLAQPSQITLWEGLHGLVYGLFWIACVGVLLRNHYLASMAIVIAWVLVVLTCIDIGMDIFHGKLYLGDFLTPLLFAAFALKIAGALRAQARTGVMPPDS